jgi:NAD(P)-dependent dehydrogenase (short-subunit alcohol dehydrogenase family)
MGFKGFDLTGKVAVVVGGTSGIGRAITCGLAEAGADVVPTSRRREEVEAAAKDVESRGRKAVRVTSDVTDLVSLESALTATLEDLGKVDILVNCAGRTKRQPTLDVSEEDWNAILDTNLTGTLRACRVFGRHMLERGSGRIVNIASLSSFVALFEVAAYSASKAAVRFLGEGLRARHAGDGVRISVICPGFVATPLTAHNPFPMPLLLSAERAARIIERGLARGTARIAFPRRAYWAVRLLAALPSGLIDRRLARVPSKE